MGRAGDAQHRIIDRVLRQLQTQEAQARLTGVQIQTSFEECVADPNFVEILGLIDGIVSKYEGGDFRLAELDSDIMKLGSYLFYLSGRVNAVEMVALEAENGFKAALSRAFIEAKGLASDEKGRLSDEVAKAIAQVAADDIRTHTAQKKIVAHTAKGLYYAGAQLLKMMNDISWRASRERFQGGQL